jgi:putative two-component system response regulator
VTEVIKERDARILVVDDEAPVAELLCRYLASEGYSCAAASSGETAMDMLGRDEYHLVLCDMMMPGMSGIDLLTVIKPVFPKVAVVMVTAVDDRKTAVTALELGAYGYIIKPFSRNEILINVAAALERRRLTLISEQYEHALEAEVRERTLQVRRREEEIIFRLLSAMGYRDIETGTHVQRIGLYSFEMARALGWMADEANDIKLAATMHDIGKVAIPDHILTKPGPLTHDEFELMKKHTVIGASILERSQIPLLHMARDIALGHHERWNGSGYPRTLAGEAIPKSALIVAIVDVYDALVHDRPYRPAMSEEKALSIIMAGNGRLFGQEILECFLSLLPRLREIRTQVMERDIGLQMDLPFRLRTSRPGLRVNEQVA